MSEIDDLLRSLGFQTSEKAENTAPSFPSVREMDPFVKVLTSGGLSSTESALGENLLASEWDAPRLTSPVRGASKSKGVATEGRLAREKSWNRTGRFFPVAPDTVDDSGLHVNEISDLLMKSLAMRGIESGYNIARMIGMKFPLVETVLRQLKVDRLVSYRNSAAGGDYLYELTDQGRARALLLAEHNSYMGAAPVPLAQYVDSVKAQSLEGRKPSIHEIRRAFSDLRVEENLISSLGQAVHSGRGMFLYGPAGNGKTSLAERITKSFGDTIWIPYCISASGEMIRLFDPNRHKLAPVVGADPELMDGRWVQIERPTIIAGGELRMENLEITYIRRTGVGEAPLQMKANCGTLLIDDFGRQRMSIDELLNRWIVPLEQRYDYLHLESGRSIQVPFDELIIFSTNLQPKDLVDEAFLRRIPYKIEVQNPTEDSFRELFISAAAQSEFQCAPELVEYLIQHHYHRAGRSFRFCHPRDLLRQMENTCTLHELEWVVTKDLIDKSVANYFAIMIDDATPAVVR